MGSIIASAFRDVSMDVRDMRHAEYMLCGGRGSTKSSFISIMIVLGLLLDADANAIVYRRVGNTLKDSVYAQIVWAIGMLQRDGEFICRKSPMEIIRPATGQRILFRGADDPMKSKSIKLTHGYFKYLWLEELTEFRGMEDIRSIKQSVLRGGESTVTFYSYNPPRSAQNWVNREVLLPRADRLVHKSTYLDVIWEHREWLGESFISEAEAVKATNERAYRNEYLGEVTGTGGTVFDNLVLREISADEICTLDRFYNGLDFGFAVDPDAFTRWAYDRRERKLYAIDEFYGAHNKLDRLAEEVRARCCGQPVTCDSADPRMINELRTRGITTVAAKKGPGSIEHGMRWLQDLGEIIVDSKRTPHIAEEFRKYEYLQARDGTFLSDYPDKDNHTIDSARYGLEREIGRKIAVTRSDIY